MRPPVVFISHGAPTVALEEHEDYARALARFGRSAGPLRAIVVMSAHWESAGPARVTTAGRPELIYDFYGFPDPLYTMTYPAPGDPNLAQEMVSLLARAGCGAAAEMRRGWDHGVWVPLRLMFPVPVAPVIEISLPRPSTPADLLRVGSAMAPLRDSGVLLIGSGGIVHNLRRIRLEEKEGPVDDWAREFDDWFADRLARRDVEALVSYRSMAPHAALAAPTTEHFDPVFFVLGASDAGDPILTIHEGIQFGNLSMRSFAC
ncbi:MAG TPA: class III extradiol ring-cleavage dioxygenase [Patescibacteria group bacterium]|jgi:4,5-DOPA dioxygenase extradiol|nr:class III extradiol ring-cleavage dioxygenase [Patescibacteria group bacterium]